MSTIYSTNQWAGARCNGNCMAIITPNQTITWFDVSRFLPSVEECPAVQTLLCTQVRIPLHPWLEISSLCLSWIDGSVHLSGASWTKEPVYKTNEAEKKNTWILRPNNSRGSSHLVAPAALWGQHIECQRAGGMDAKEASSSSSLCCAWISKWWIFFKRQNS